MKITSFDIGEGNLAYMIVDCKVVKKKIKISDCAINEFNLINLMDTTQNQFEECGSCKAPLKTGKKKGQLCGGKTDKGSDYCKRHDPNKEKAKKVKKVEKVEKKKKPKYLNVKKICINMIDILDKVTNLTDTDVIVIERQPPKNKKMGEISHYLYMYLQYRLSKEKKTAVKLMYLTAQNRMIKLCEHFKDIQFKKNNSHYNRKQNAIKLMNYILDNYLNDDGSKKIKTLRKKDDVSDCFVQVLWYLIKNKSIEIVRK